jgi:DNA polymerase
MESVNTYWSDRALLEWQIELGADEATSETPIDRYALDPAPVKVVAKVVKDAPPPPVAQIKIDTVQLAETAAANAGDLAALAQAMEAFDHCQIKRGARSFVFADGQPAARVMIIGDAPNRAEDVAGKPFVGQEGSLLDKMLAAIGLDRAATDPATAVYLTNILPWRPPGNGAPAPADLAMMLPFVKRHIALANPDVLILMGSNPCEALLGRAGMTRIRGQWQDVAGRPAMPMFPPSHLLKQTAAKREAWADLLSLKAKLRELS